MKHYFIPTHSIKTENHEETKEKDDRNWNTQWQSENSHSTIDVFIWIIQYFDSLKFMSMSEIPPFIFICIFESIYFFML